MNYSWQWRKHLWLSSLIAPLWRSRSGWLCTKQSNIRVCRFFCFVKNARWLSCFRGIFAGCPLLWKPWHIRDAKGASSFGREWERWRSSKKGETTSCSKYVRTGIWRELVYQGKEQGNLFFQKGKNNDALKQYNRWISQQNRLQESIYKKTCKPGVFWQLQRAVLSSRSCWPIGLPRCSRWAGSPTVWKTSTRPWGWATPTTFTIRCQSGETDGKMETETEESPDWIFNLISLQVLERKAKALQQLGQNCEDEVDQLNQLIQKVDLKHKLYQFSCSRVLFLKTN